MSTLLWQLSDASIYTQLPERALYSLCASFTISYEPLSLLVSATHPPMRRPALLRVLSPALEPLELQEVLAIINMIPVNKDAPQPRLESLAYLSKSLPGDLTEQDLYSLVLAVPQSGRTDVLHFVLFKLPTAVSLTISVGTFYHVLKALAPEHRMEGVNLMRARLQEFSFTMQQFVPFVKFFPPPHRAAMIRTLSPYLPVFTSVSEVLEVLVQINESAAKIHVFAGIAPQLASSMSWDDIPQLLKEFPTPDRVPVIARVAQALPASPRLDQLADIMAVFPESLAGADHKAKSLSLLMQKSKVLLSAEEFIAHLLLLPPKSRSSVVPAFVPHLRVLTAKELSVVLCAFPDNYGHRVGALTDLRPRIAPLISEELVQLVLLFETKGSQFSCIEVLVGLVDHFHPEMILQLYPNDRSKISEALRRGR